MAQEGEEKVDSFVLPRLLSCSVISDQQSLSADRAASTRPHPFAESILAKRFCTMSREPSSFRQTFLVTIQLI
jgi:hypothetical protein